MDDKASNPNSNSLSSSLFIVISLPNGKLLHYKHLCLGFKTEFSHLSIAYFIVVSLNSLYATMECRGWTHDLLVSIGKPYQLSYIHLSLSLSYVLP